MKNAYLVLEDGTVFCGNSWGAQGLATADLFICTAMTGYQGVLADPSHASSIVLMTAPHIGNVGINSEDSHTLRARGVIVREAARRPSNWKSQGRLDDALLASGVIGITGIDTRAVTLHVRNHGAPMRCAIVSGDALPTSVASTDHDLTTAVVQVAAAAILSSARDIALTVQEER